MTISLLITGGTGFVGRAIVEAVKQKHADWVTSVLDLHPPQERIPDVFYQPGDITNAAEVDRVLAQTKPTVVIHTAGIVPPLASRYGRKDRDRVFLVNVDGTRNILTAAKAHGVEALVWTGSFTAVTDDMRIQYPNINETWPTSSNSLIYGESKACFISDHGQCPTDKIFQTAAEALVLAANDEKFATCALRPSVLFGPGDCQFIPSLYACIAKGETPFIVGDGLNMWDVTYGFMNLILFDDDIGDADHELATSATLQMPTYWQRRTC